MLNRSTLPPLQPVPQPNAGSVKYGCPLAGLMGARSPAVLPVATWPSDSPTTRNEVELVKISAHRSVTAPRPSMTIGYRGGLNWAAMLLPMRESCHAPVHVSWAHASPARACRSPSSSAVDTSDPAGKSRDRPRLNVIWLGLVCGTVCAALLETPLPTTVTGLWLEMNAVTASRASLLVEVISVAVPAGKLNANAPWLPGDAPAHATVRPVMSCPVLL